MPRPHAEYTDRHSAESAMFERALCDGGGIWFLACLPAAATIAVLAIILRVERAVAQRAAKTLCHRCDYDLAGLEGGVCPECGARGALLRKRFPTEHRFSEGPQTMATPFYQ